MSAKQDGVFPRTAADLEQKYNFNKTFGEIMGIATDARTEAENATASVGNLDNKLNSEEIFNRLTENGKIQGLFRDEDGELYINAQYIQSIEQLLAKDLTMTGKFTNTVDVFLEPEAEEIKTIQQHILGNVTIPSELIPYYDFNNDGQVTILDLGIAQMACLGVKSLSDRDWKYKDTKSKVTLTIDLSSPEKAIKLSGTNLWGRKIENYIGALNGDSVINSGIVDGWIFKKWSSGIADLSYRKTISASSITQGGSNGSELYSNPITISLPFQMKNIVVTAIVGGQCKITNGTIPNAVFGDSIEFRIMKNQTLPTTDFEIHISLTGFWK